MQYRSRVLSGCWKDSPIVCDCAYTDGLGPTTPSFLKPGGSYRISAPETCLSEHHNQAVASAQAGAQLSVPHRARPLRARAWLGPCLRRGDGVSWCSFGA